MKNLLILFIAIYTATLMSSCGTIAGALSHHKRPVFMMQSPADIQVSMGGVKQTLKIDAFASTSIGNTTTTYYGTSVRLPYRHDTTIVIYSPSLNKTATIHLKSKGKGIFLFVDLFISGPLGIALDVATHNHRTLKPKLIDVQSALDGKPIKEWRSQGKLKRMAKRGAVRS